MDVSGVMTQSESLNDVSLSIDLLPDIDSHVTLQHTLTDRRSDGGRRRVANVHRSGCQNDLPMQLVAHTAGNNDSDLTIAELPKRMVGPLIGESQGLGLPINGTKGFAKAEVTAGGVALAQIDPRTMASRVAEDLYVAGEVMDVDGLIGGYNFQAAFSTGRAAAGTRPCDMISLDNA